MNLTDYANALDGVCVDTRIHGEKLGGIPSEMFSALSDPSFKSHLAG